MVFGKLWGPSKSLKNINILQSSWEGRSLVVGMLMRSLGEKSFLDDGPVNKNKNAKHETKNTGTGRYKVPERKHSLIHCQVKKSLHAQICVLVGNICWYTLGQRFPCLQDWALENPLRKFTSFQVDLVGANHPHLVATKNCKKIIYIVGKTWPSQQLMVLLMPLTFQQKRPVFSAKRPPRGLGQTAWSSLWSLVDRSRAWHSKNTHGERAGFFFTRFLVCVLWPRRTGLT